MRGWRRRFVVILVCSVAALGWPQFDPGAASASAADDYVFGADSPITPANPGSQSSPEVSGNIAVWSDYMTNYAGAKKYRILMQDLSISQSGEPAAQVHVLAEGDLFAGKPDIDGNLVVWQKHFMAAGGSNRYQIHYMYVGNGCPGAAGCDRILPVTFTSYFDTAPRPRISGTRIVWIDTTSGTDDIHMYDLTIGTETVIADGAYDQHSPAIDGDWVTWLESGDYYLGSPGINDIHARNVVTGETRAVTSDARLMLQEDADISGSKIAWSVNGSPNHSAFVYDIATGQTQNISGSDNAHHVRIENGILVWAAYRAEYLIMMHDLASGVTQQVSNGPSTYRATATTSSGHILWVDERNGARAVFRNRLGVKAGELAEKYAPELNFVHDITRDDRADFEPRTVGLMADAAEKLVIAGGEEIENPSIQDLINNSGADGYLDLPGSPGNPLHDFDDGYRSQLGQGDYPVTAYSRVVPRAEGTDKTVIQYWLNYYYNNWVNNHEGDWEMVEVILNGNLEPEAAAYSQHGRAFRKYWNEFGFSKAGTHPKVFVAEGSHANYFFESSALHFLDAATMFAFKDRTGSSSRILPAVDKVGLSGGWTDFAGLWGQRKPAWCVWCDDGPAGPAFQPGDPWNLPLTWSDSSALKGYLNDWIIAAHSPVEIHLYDPEGNHVGKSASGTIDMQIPGAEYFERDDDHSKNIVVHNADFLADYTLRIEGTGTGNMDLDVQVPDFGANVVSKAQYLGVEITPSSKVALDVNPARTFGIQIDENGDGVFERQQQPDLMESVDADLTPPDPVTDLYVTDTTSGSTSLAWTSTGDDGEQGTALAYDLRYSAEPITADNWQYAERADSLPDPLPAGSPQVATIAGLDADTAYFFAIKARDDSWQESALSISVFTKTEIPILNWSTQRMFWASWNDYRNRQLSIDYRMGNTGTGTALNSTVQASACLPDIIYCTTALPVGVGDLEPGMTVSVSMKYFVPAEVARFTTSTVATCDDDAGRVYWFPTPLQ